MKSTSTLFFILAVVLGAFMMPLTTTAFAPAGRNLSVFSNPSLSSSASAETTTQLFFFGQPKDDGSPGDYVCKDCGYVFTKGPQAWAKLDDKYKCPPCGAPKFRFNKVPKGSASGKVEVKKSWF